MNRAFSIGAILLGCVHAADYGLDCSFPIHGKELTCGDLLGDRKTFYENYVEGCRNYYGVKAARCDVFEEERILMSQRQPQSMVVSNAIRPPLRLRYHSVSLCSTFTFACIDRTIRRPDLRRLRLHPKFGSC